MATITYITHDGDDYEADLVETAQRILANAKARGADIPLPTDVVVAREFAATAHADVRSIHEVAGDEMILDKIGRAHV